MPEQAVLPAAVAAFDAVADRFDGRFGAWQSVAAQRAAVRGRLLRAFPPDAHVLELAGGTGLDALYLALHGRRVTTTDGSPAMVAQAAARAATAGLGARVAARQLVLEELSGFACEAGPFDGAFSNFAGLNCVRDLRSIARGLARLLPTGAPALLVLFGPLPPGEVLVQLARGDAGAAFRRLRRGAVPASIGGHAFDVYYHRPGAVRAAFAPWFRLERTRGIGVFVPPSAAEPRISSWPRVVRILERLDRMASAPLALLGDHVLYEMVRTGTEAEAA